MSGPSWWHHNHLFPVSTHQPYYKRRQPLPVSSQHTGSDWFTPDQTGSHSLFMVLKSSNRWLLLQRDTKIAHLCFQDFFISPVRTDPGPGDLSCGGPPSLQDHSGLTCWICGSEVNWAECLLFGLATCSLEWTLTSWCFCSLCVTRHRVDFDKDCILRNVQTVGMRLENRFL